MPDPKPIPYASADPVADLLADEYGMDYEQAAEVSQRIRTKQMADTFNVTGEALNRTVKNEAKRMDTLVTNAKRYAGIKARKEAGAELAPDEQDFYTRVRGAALQKMATEATTPRAPDTEQRVNSIRHLGFGPGGGGEPQDPNDAVFQAMDHLNTGMDRARQLQTESQAFKTTAHGRVPVGPGAEAAQGGMMSAAGGGGAAVGPANGMGGPAPQMDIAALLRKRWEEEQLKAANGGFGPIPMDVRFNDGMRAGPYEALDPMTYLNTLGRLGVPGLPRSGK